MFSTQHIYHLAKRCNASPMDIDIIRKQNLILLQGRRSQRDVADLWDTSASTLSQITSQNGKRNLGKELARRIEEIEGLPDGWMDVPNPPGSEGFNLLRIENLSDKDRRAKLEVDLLADTVEGDNFLPGPDIRGLCPLISWVSAGSWCEVTDIYAVGDAEKWLPCPISHGPRTFVVRVRGESMLNPHGRRSFRDGDLIFVDPDQEPANGSLIIAKLEDSQEATFKQLVIEGDERYLKALNPAWPEPIIRINGNATITGVVILKAEVM